MPPDHFLRDRLHHLVIFLQGADPGLQRLTHAGKTVAAVVLALLLFQGQPAQARLFAGVSTAMLMQCTSTGSRRRQQQTLVVMGLSTLAAVALEGSLRGHRALQQPLLVLLAALVMYVRRFLPDRNQFPVFGFVLALLAALLPAPPGQVPREVLAVASGLVLAFVTCFYVLPPQPRRAFDTELALFCRRAAVLLRALERTLRGAPLGPRAAAALLRQRDALRDSTDLGRRLAEQVAQTGAPAPEGLVRQQHQALQSLGFLLDCVQELVRLPGAVLTPLVGPARGLRRRFALIAQQALRRQAPRRRARAPLGPLRQARAALAPLDPIAVQLRIADMAVTHLLDIQDALAQALGAEGPR